MIWSQLQTQQLPVDTESALDTVRSGPYAYMSDNTQLEYSVAKHCDAFVTTGYTFNVNGLAFAVAKGKPYLDEFSYK